MFAHSMISFAVMLKPGCWPGGERCVTNPAARQIIAARTEDVDHEQEIAREVEVLPGSPPVKLPYVASNARTADSSARTHISKFWISWWPHGAPSLKQRWPSCG